jgi:hypothetical protein
MSQDAPNPLESYWREAADRLAGVADSENAPSFGIPLWAIREHATAG